MKPSDGSWPQRIGCIAQGLAVDRGLVVNAIIRAAQGLLDHAFQIRALVFRAGAAAQATAKFNNRGNFVVKSGLQIADPVDRVK